MQNSKTVRDSAERHFYPQTDRDEKGSAMRTIAAQSTATQAKSARLRALRLAQEATIVVEPVKKKRASRAKTAA